MFRIWAVTSHHRVLRTVTLAASYRLFVSFKSQVAKWIPTNRALSAKAGGGGSGTNKSGSGPVGPAGGGGAGGKAGTGDAGKTTGIAPTGGLGSGPVDGKAADTIDKSKKSDAPGLGTRPVGGGAVGGMKKPTKSDDKGLESRTVGGGEVITNSHPKKTSSPSLGSAPIGSDQMKNTQKTSQLSAPGLGSEALATDGRGHVVVKPNKVAPAPRSAPPIRPPPKVIKKKPIHEDTTKVRNYPTTAAGMEERYVEQKKDYETRNMPMPAVRERIFPCNDLNLNKIQVYGFDYDYTLAIYNEKMHDLLYNYSIELLVKKSKYPRELLEFSYDPKFAIRGLHYDIGQGLIMKLDSYLQIQFGTVHRGRTALTDDQVLQIYRSPKLPIDYVEGKVLNYGKSLNKMMLLADLFSLPHACLICDIAEFFYKNNYTHHPGFLFFDIDLAVGMAHSHMHEELMSQPERYIEQKPRFLEFLKHFRNEGKQTFLLTNSPFKFIDHGMTFLIDSDWRKYFDVIVVEAKKPYFFTDAVRPFRVYDPDERVVHWDEVKHLEPGVIYSTGCVSELMRLTKWKNSSILYFGDQLYADLAEVTLKHGWRTGAIIQELGKEMDILNQNDYIHNVTWLHRLSRLIEYQSDNPSKVSTDFVSKWKKESYNIRQDLQTRHNPRFGSLFRTKTNPSYFSRRLFRYADIYAEDITYLLEYSVTHHFLPRRGIMPHDYLYFFN